MIKLQNVSFQYKDSEQGDCLSDISLHIQKGEVVLLCGKSGCGKTSVTRLINGLIPGFFAGQLSGTALVAGQDVSEQPIHQTARMVGSVFQNPRTQFFNIDTTGEVVFGCENIGIEHSEIEIRLQQTVEDFQIENLMNRNLFHLSGGEKQKIACASVSMLCPDVIVLDEPASNLDWHSIYALAEIILKWKRQGKTVVIAEHRLSYLRRIADRVIYMESGRTQQDMAADTFWRLPTEEIRRLGLRSLVSIPFPVEADKQGESFSLEDFAFSYPDGTGISIPALEIPKSAIVGVIGRNGAGKTTFARCLCGLEKKAKGRLVWNGNPLNAKKRLKLSYLVMQDVNHQLFTESVHEEITLGMERSDDEHIEREADEIIAGLDLTALRELHPLSLSGGQKQRVAIGSAIASGKEIMVFDEPTSGLDYHHMLEVAHSLRRLSDMGKTCFIVTHDPELIAECCNYFIFFESGMVKWSGPSSEQSAKLLQAFFNTQIGCDA